MTDVARTSAQIEADIDEIRAAMAQGVSSVSYEGRTVTYRSHDSMRQALADLRDELAAADGQAVRRRHYAEFGRGY